MIRIGLTGGIGMGKSTCAQLLAQRGLVVVDTDELARQVVSPGQPALAEVRAVFGEHIIGIDGQLRRDLLAQRVFEDAAAREQLEAILHPRIRKLWQDRLAACESESAKSAVVVIPLLFETNAESAFDTVFCVACTADSQWERVRCRGWSREHLAQRRAAQMPVAEKMLRAQRVIWTEGRMELLAMQLDRLLGELGFQEFPRK